MIDTTKHNRTIKLLSWILILNFFDILTTIMNFVYHSDETDQTLELNPIVSYFLNNGFLSFALFKIFSIQLVISLLYYRAIKYFEYPRYETLLFINIAYFLVILWNSFMFIFPFLI